MGNCSLWYVKERNSRIENICDVVLLVGVFWSIIKNIIFPNSYSKKLCKTVTECNNNDQPEFQHCYNSNLSLWAGTTSTCLGFSVPVW